MTQVLVVDDEPMMRRSLSEILRRHGIEVGLAANGEEALALFEKAPSQLVFTDVRMPQMDGLALLRGIKAIAPQTQVVMITAYGSVELAVEEPALREA